MEGHSCDREVDDSEQTSQGGKCLETNKNVHRTQRKTQE